MRKAPQNIRPFFNRKLWLFLVCFFISIWSGAQDTATKIEVYDTSGDSADESNTMVMEKSDYEEQNYFTYRSSGEQADTIEWRHVPASVVDSLKSDEAFWYANSPKKKNEEPEKKSHQWFKTLVWILIVGAFLAALVWYLVTSDIVIFGKRKKIMDRARDEEELTENIFGINYQKEIDKAVLGQNYRLAVRLMFLRLLKNLSDKNIIQYRHERTNFDYLSQLFSSSYYNDFFRLTRNYEYTWYGKFDVSQEAFGAIKNDFENFDRKLH